MTWYAHIAEMLALIHLAHTELCVQIHEHDLERARRGLDKALQARDAAHGRVLAHELATLQVPHVPPYLRKDPDRCSPSGC